MWLLIDRNQEFMKNIESVLQYLYLNSQRSISTLKHSKMWSKGSNSRLSDFMFPTLKVAQGRGRKLSRKPQLDPPGCRLQAVSKFTLQMSSTRLLPLHPSSTSNFSS
jgi:hypothetical protein